jgi:GR25 family glycosyltransferase involved in LPS biosynthesis
MSFIEILKICFNKKYDNVLIIEDDALFHNDFINHMKLLSENVKSINFNYDIIWLCPNWLYKNNNEILNRCYSYTYINDHFSLVSSSKSIDNNLGSTLNNGGNIFSRKCIEFILNTFENSEQKEIDMWFRQYIQTKNSVYTSVPNLIQQRVEESSIEGFKVNYDKDIHYKTRMKFNIFSIVEEKDKELYLENLKNNLQKMIGYEKIYYISDKKLFTNEILVYVNQNDLETNIDELKNNFKNKVNDNQIKYFYYMDINTKFENNYLPFDENNNLVIKDNFY